MKIEYQIIRVQKRSGAVWYDIKKVWYIQIFGLKIKTYNYRFYDSFTSETDAINWAISISGYKTESEKVVKTIN